MLSSLSVDAGPLGWAADEVLRGCLNSHSTNLTLVVCAYHHHNFATRGWTCRINPDGIPEWRPPRSVDRDQKPMINTRITALHATRTRRRQ